MNQIEDQVCAKFENLKLGRLSTVNKSKVQENVKIKLLNYNSINKNVNICLYVQCVEWWCPVHSAFEEIIKTIKPETEDDIKIIRRAKARNAYWKKGGQVTKIQKCVTY